jgi:hypothetical protein
MGKEWKSLDTRFKIKSGGIDKKLNIYKIFLKK